MTFKNFIKLRHNKSKSKRVDGKFEGDNRVKWFDRNGIGKFTLDDGFEYRGNVLNVGANGYLGNVNPLVPPFDFEPKDSRNVRALLNQTCPMPEAWAGDDDYFDLEAGWLNTTYGHHSGAGKKFSDKSSKTLNKIRSLVFRSFRAGKEVRNGLKTFTYRDRKVLQEPYQQFGNYNYQQIDQQTDRKMEQLTTSGENFKRFTKFEEELLTKPFRYDYQTYNNPEAYLAKNIYETCQETRWLSKSLNLKSSGPTTRTCIKTNPWLQMSFDKEGSPRLNRESERGNEEEDILGNEACECQSENSFRILADTHTNTNTNDSGSKACRVRTTNTLQKFQSNGDSGFYESPPNTATTNQSNFLKSLNKTYGRAELKSRDNSQIGLRQDCSALVPEIKGSFSETSFDKDYYFNEALDEEFYDSNSLSYLSTALSSERLSIRSISLSSSYTSLADCQYENVGRIGREYVLNQRQTYLADIEDQSNHFRPDLWYETQASLSKKLEEYRKKIEDNKFYCMKAKVQMVK